MNPFFSIITPLYNNESFIGFCLDSLFSQSFGDFEVIVINDGSTDGSARVCEEYLSDHPNLRLLDQENSGQAVARNKGIAVASGEYLLFVDSDDFLVGDDALEKLAASIKMTRPDVLVYLPVEYNEPADEIVRRFPGGKWEQNRLYRADEILDDIYRENGNWVTQTQTKIVRREFVLEKALTYPEGVFHEDDEWLAEVYLSCETISFLYEPLYGRRRNGNSTTNKREPDWVYRTTCDKTAVGAMMISHRDAKRYTHYLRYNADYFLNVILRGNTFDDERRERFTEFLKPYRRLCRKIISPKAPKESLKAAFILVFGMRSYLRLYRRKQNG